MQGNHDTTDERSEQLVFRMRAYSLNTRLLYADLGTEVDLELIRGLLRFQEILDVDHLAYADVYFVEFLPADHGYSAASSAVKTTNDARPSPS